MKTISSVMNRLREQGFKQEFVVRGNLLRSPGIEKSYDAAKVKVLNFYRFEGESDPGDNSILYALETDDGLKGLLIDAYGAYADAGIGEFIREVEEINKKSDHRSDNPGTN